MKKKILAILMAAAMCFCFCACGNNNGSTEETVEITTVAADQQEDEEESISVYHQIYNDYAAKMDELEKSDNGKMDDLDKIFEEGKEKMKDAMLESTEDDENTYEKWFAKLSEKYSEVARELTN
ncbi:MAG: hypothetical protein Q4D99_00870 [Bacillota bacterium]|nr:hypothetical protein [Bacillota bacterium]